MNNITTNISEWLESISSYESENNITSELSKAGLATGLIIDKTNLKTEYLILPDTEAADNFIVNWIEQGRQIYIHSLIKSKYQDTSKLEPKEQTVIEPLPEEASEETLAEYLKKIESQEQEINLELQNLPFVECVILTVMF